MCPALCGAKRARGLKSSVGGDGGTAAVGLEYGCVGVDIGTKFCAAPNDAITGHASERIGGGSVVTGSRTGAAPSILDGSAA
mmetsp:Transcript_29349/g.54976  ORF Transcript_29349/g.54976 Transcript_29349/m.54976 type:complete len:82 (-) Transcript_29349:3-248(-)